MCPANYTNPDAEAKRVGHILGIRGGAKMKLAPHLQTFTADTEINFHPITAGYIQEKLNEFKPTQHQETWTDIRQMFSYVALEAEQLAASAKSDLDEKSKIDKLFGLNVKEKKSLFGQKSPDQIYADQLKRYQSDQPVHICSGWEGHHIGVTLYKGYIVVSNRGEQGVPGEGTIIYKLDHEPSIEEIAQLQKTITTKDVHFEEIQQQLNHLQGEKIAAFPQKQQGKDTCSYVNKLAATEGVLCLLALDKQGKLNDQNIRAYAADPNNRKAYKEFTRANRESEVNRIISLIEQAEQSNDQEQLSVMVNIAYKAILKQDRKSPNRQKEEDEFYQNEKLLAAIKPHQQLLTKANQEFYPLVEIRHQFRLEERSAARSKTPPPEPPQRMDRIPSPRPVAKAPNPNGPPPKVPPRQDVNPKTDMPAQAPIKGPPPPIPRRMEDAAARAPEKAFSEMINQANSISELAKGIQEFKPAIQDAAGQSVDKSKLARAVASLEQEKEANVKSSGFIPNLIAKGIIRDFGLRDKVIDFCFKRAIERASDMNELANIIEKYPKDKIVSNSGQEYSPRAIAERLRTEKNINLMSVTSSLGIRAAVQKLKVKDLLENEIDKFKKEDVKPENNIKRFKR